MSKLKRCSSKRKQEVVLRLLRGESLDALSRTGQPAAVLSFWRGSSSAPTIPRWQSWSRSSSRPSTWSAI